MFLPRGLGIFLSILLVIRLAWAIEQAPDADKTSKSTESSHEKTKNKLARGWGDSIPWMELEAGIEKAKEEKKPLMLIIHKTWCGACQTLKGKFAKAKMIAELAKKFIMVNAEDDEEPWEEEYQPDGGKYIPRIFFLSPDGQVLKDVVNPKDEYKQYPYYYSNPAPIITVMQSVLKKYGLPVPGDAASSDEKKTEKAKKEETSKDKDVKKEKSEEKEEAKPDEDVKKGECPKMAKAKKEAAEKKEKKEKDLPRKVKKESGEAPGDDEQPKPPAHKPPQKEL